jgi:hypothetical protein
MFSRNTCCARGCARSSASLTVGTGMSAFGVRGFRASGVGS